MLQYVLQNYFCILLYIIIQVNYVILSESATGKATTLSDIGHRSKCTNENCTCVDVPQWYGVQCRQSSFPELILTRVKYLPERMFVGLRIFAVWLMDPDVTVADNVLEGILGLDAFLVQQSRIKVI